MDFEVLNTFVTLSKTRNFTQAANKLFVAQSTVTNRINELETEVGVRLFTRNNRMVELTSAGERFLAYSQKVLDITSTTLSEISATKKFVNTIRIGAADSIYEAHLAQMILDYRKRHPEYAVRISIGQSSHLNEQLTDGILDIVFGYLPFKKSNYSCSVFKEDEMVLVTDSANKKYENGIHKEELLEINYIMCNFALQDVGQYIRGLFPNYYQFSLEIDDCSKIIPYLIDEDSYTFLPRDMASSYIRDKSLREIPLIDFSTPVINSYIIADKNKINLWTD